MQSVIQSRDFFAASIPDCEALGVRGSDKSMIKTPETMSFSGHDLNTGGFRSS
jgi:hypothetical protein